ncbi:putative integral membrane protein [Babesia bovis T2Bo]|uniref:Uncharacterized protein n=1 Tax=Babesia bovis TaxID=5865 RepID=A7AQH2_BABBO|nr:putative integral membrane protein [Babesia bovis T2Bo]EDO06791.1 putative integral membrane protein [Babesia bovis T2Bo]|eukprot:XP_001610359.1 hypothetical protein [Babesia bovis T2Bo]
MNFFSALPFGQRRAFSRFARASADLRASLPKRITPKHHQKPLGSYPFPPEHEMLWKNRRQVPGGYFHQAISPFQLKFCYPLIHQAYARIWAKTSQMFWWVIWPTTMAITGFLAVEAINTKYVKRIHYD